MKELKRHIDEPPVLKLMEKLLHRLDDLNAVLIPAEKGITQGSPLSPLFGALYLSSLDKALGEYCDKHKLFYRRFMDDWIILCKKRGQLRRVVRMMNEILAQMKMTKHPFKTYIGRIKNEGFDFLGYRISINSTKVAWNTWMNHQNKLLRLYEQNLPDKEIGEYVKRWLTWV